jgi:hypothetical protein
MALGGAGSTGAGQGGGTLLGGQFSAAYENDARNHMLYGELFGQSFDNGKSEDPNNNGSTTQFGQFRLSLGYRYGIERAKIDTPFNVSFARDILANESFRFRWAIIGVYLKVLDKSDADAATKQKLEILTDFATQYVAYNKLAMPNCVQATPYDPPCYTDYSQSSTTYLGLYAALKYQIEKNGWGGTIQADIFQVQSRKYSRLESKLLAYKALSGKYKSLRPFIEVSGLYDYDEADHYNTSKGAIRGIGGLSIHFDK